MQLEKNFGQAQSNFGILGACAKNLLQYMHYLRRSDYNDLLFRQHMCVVWLMWLSNQCRHCTCLNDEALNGSRLLKCDEDQELSFQFCRRTEIAIEICIIGTIRLLPILEVHFIMIDD